MKLIADSGSTKTDWRLIKDQVQILQLNSIGFNPYFQTTNDIYAEINSTFQSHMDLVGDLHSLSIYYYGAGCSTLDKVAVVKQALEKAFPKSEIHVEHDLLAAARAICGRKPGIAAILGTGSNTCYFDGNKIVENVPSLGYLLGDEGSGAHIGKSFIKTYLDNDLPPEIAHVFNAEYKLTRESILDSIYKKPMPSKYLASFSKFIHSQIDHPFIYQLVRMCFVQFFEKHICKYPLHKEVEMGCVGSVGYNYSSILKEVAAEKGVNLTKIVVSPTDELIAYHTA